MGVKLQRGDSDFSELIEEINLLILDTATAFLPEVVILLWVFTAGPTIYAPVSSFLAITVQGLLYGARISHGGGFLPIATEVIFSSISAYLLTAYSSFVTLTSMRIFTDTKADKKRELFDGVMFRAEGFKKAYNLRYILSYILFFVLFALLLGIFSYVKAFLLSL